MSKEDPKGIVKGFERELTDFRSLWKRNRSVAILFILSALCIAYYKWGPSPDTLTKWISSVSPFKTEQSAAILPYAPPLPHRDEIAIRNMILRGCEDARNARKLYQTARDLPDQDVREAEYTLLVRDAVCGGDEAFAGKLYAELTLQEHRISAARWAIDIHMTARRYAEARKWVPRLPDLEDRTWWLQRILEEEPRKG